MLQLLGDHTVKQVLGVLVAAALGAALGCRASPRMAAAPAPAVSAAPTGDPRAQIEALDREITDALTRARVAPPEIAACSGAACAQAMSQPFALPPGADPACRPAPSQQCTDVCTISTSICDNQQKICDLARQLDGDDWAANKCERARASCKASHEACCQCAG